MRVSIIIPAWQDNQALSRLLADLQCLRPAASQIIVVGGCEDQQSEQLCRQYAARWLVSRPCRGLQMDTGAQAANGEVLWFVHADSVVHNSALQQITEALTDAAVGGYFRFRFTGTRSWRLRWFERLTNWRTRLGVPYGDQGLFLRADVYRQCGGFPRQALFEEVPLVKRARRVGAFRMLPHALPTSPRRWQRDGWWRRTLTNRALALGYAAGISPQRLHQWYSRPQSAVADDQQAATVKTSSRS